MRSISIICAFLLSWSSLVLAQADENISAEEQEYISWAKGVWESLDRQTGTVSLPQAGATLEVPDNFYYLDPDDAEKVLVEVWGNPPGQYTLGMLFPSDSTPFDDNSWGVSIEYEEDGYVSDADADDIDYGELLQQMKDDTASASRERINQDYEAVELIGWAATPYYETSSHKLHWAKEIKFGNSDYHTLNYNIRVLGRKGVLVLNFIAGMDQQAMIETQLNSVLSMANFDQGSRYSDFNPSIDKVAAYGLGALVTGKVIAKTGFLAMALVFLKKFGVLIVIGIGAVLKSPFGRKKEA